MATATYKGRNFKTLGNWIGVFGTDGYYVIGGVDGTTDSSSYPSYVSGFTVSGNSTHTWGSSDSRMLQRVGGSGRTSKLWYSGSSLNVTMAFSSAKLLTLYATSDDSNIRIVTFEIRSNDDNSLLDSRTFRDYQTIPHYFSWVVNGNIKVVVKNETGSTNATVAGFFFDPDPGVTLPTASASLVGTDTTIQGGWIGDYGSDGYYIKGGQDGTNDALSLPTYATRSGIAIKAPGSNNDTPSATKHLQQVNTPASITSLVWYHNSTFSFYLDLFEEKKVSVYCVEVDAFDRTQTIKVKNPNDGTVYASQQLTGFTSTPTYVTFLVKGEVEIEVKLDSTPTCVAQGIFFDSSNPTVAAADTLSLTDAVTLSATGTNSLSDTLSLSDAMTPVMGMLKSFTDSFSLSDALSVTLFETVVPLTRSVADSFPAWRDGISWFYEGELYLAEDDAGLFWDDDVQISYVVFFNDPGALAYDSMQYNWFDEVQVQLSSAAPPLGDFLSIHDEIKILLTYGMPVSDALQLSDNFGGLYPNDTHLADALALTDFVVVSLSHVENIGISVSDSLDYWRDSVRILLSSTMTSYLRRYLNDVKN